jgi:hypothetical protein
MIEQVRHDSLVVLDVFTEWNGYRFATSMMGWHDATIVASCTSAECRAHISTICCYNIVGNGNHDQAENDFMPNGSTDKAVIRPTDQLTHFTQQKFSSYGLHYMKKNSQSKYRRVLHVYGVLTQKVLLLGFINPLRYYITSSTLLKMDSSFTSRDQIESLYWPVETFAVD